MGRTLCARRVLFETVDSVIELPKNVLNVISKNRSSLIFIRLGGGFDSEIDRGPQEINLVPGSHQSIMVSI